MSDTDQPSIEGASILPDTTDGDTLYQPFLASLEAMFSQPRPEAVRVFHGRGHCYPGLEHLNVDWYPPLLLLAFHDQPAHLEQLLGKILNADPLGQIRTVVLQSRQRHRADSEVLWGEAREAFAVMEGGLKYEVRPGRNRHAGLFLDMRPLRDWLKLHSEGRKVLNLFAYTCSLSVAALAGGASRIVSVDMNKPSMQWGMLNHSLNNQDLSRVYALPHNVFTSWGRIRQLGKYDTLIVDPPTRQAGSFDVEKNYATVIRRLPKLANPGADIIATVNSPRLDSDFLPDQFSRYAPELQYVENMPAAPEFHEKYPERGLKIYRFRMPQ